jgi:hypothetical protein
MILLKTLLTEIALNTVKPYATQIVWTDQVSHMVIGDEYLRGATYTAVVQCDGIAMKMQIDKPRGANPVYQFSFFMPKIGGPDSDGYQPYTTSASQSAGAGTLNFLRVMMTCAYAIKDFTDTHDVVSLTITGGDTTTSKVAQKTRIYYELLAANAHMFPAYKIHLIGNELYLIKKSNADSTGIKDAI